MVGTEAPMLVITEGQLVGQRWPVDQEILVIGRSETCDLVLPERQISRQHARLKREADGYYIEDLGSKNGTFVNGQPLTPFVPQRLKDGDEIALALCVRMRFVSAEVTLPLESAPIPSLLPGLFIDRAARRVWVNGREVNPPLSPAQFRALERLALARGAVVSRDELIAYIWPEEDPRGITEQALDALIRRLRERLAQADPNRDYILTIRGHGFRLADVSLHLKGQPEG
ncbi:MAG TPA: FHA domain-containing protein [Thermoflexus sp.]|uniref:FHA domain-containing protein n=1 Tax=Thermoflexus sp. TaxID=1969742 RepID=UPI002BFECD1D|nr:FHA domain-containing protein [Thermoflexus sp.]